AYQFGDVRYLDILAPFIKIKEFSAKRDIAPLEENAKTASSGEATAPRAGARRTPRPHEAIADTDSAAVTT
ncbi:hypothetical protein, partial [Trinickia sp.]|uniref:hypothetical protein n=1 Tax=Trinickia sp. TaxID=2571163 RepID=UPI003F81FABA